MLTVPPEWISAPELRRLSVAQQSAVQTPTVGFHHRPRATPACHARPIDHRLAAVRHAADSLSPLYLPSSAAGRFCRFCSEPLESPRPPRASRAQQLAIGKNAGPSMSARTSLACSREVSGLGEKAFWPCPTSMCTCQPQICRDWQLSEMPTPCFYVVGNGVF